MRVKYLLIILPNIYIKSFFYVADDKLISHNGMTTCMYPSCLDDNYTPIWYNINSSVIGSMLPNKTNMAYID